jgi:diguanylate cyclase (GGDEF)-like protein
MRIREVGRETLRWVLVVVLLLIIGASASVFEALSAANADADRSHRSFESASAEVTSTMKLAIDHEEDLLISLSAVVIANPEITSAQLQQWSTTVRASARYPELRDLAFIAVIPRAHLAAFGARDATGLSGSPVSPETVIPPGERPYYCLFEAGSGLAANAPPRALDFCAAPRTAGLIRSSGDTGVSSYQPYKTQNTVSLAVQLPLYRQGAVVATIAQRRTASLGWLGITILPSVVLDRATEGHRALAVTMRYQRDGSDVTFQRGAIPRQGESFAIDFHNGWTATTYRPPVADGVWRDGLALTLLTGGIGLSALLAALILVLATGRARAERKVHLRTDQLRHQSLHDGLTGLANRMLVADRADRLVARSRRNGSQGAALFLDLDGFKNVNDTLGHDAGDQLLVAVAARLTGAIRDADTVGRMGGDEFVVLIDDASLDADPELVAQRLLDVLRQPFDLNVNGEEVTVRIAASVGIAIGDRLCGDELIRDADVAMYQAKGAGKDSYATFHPEMESAIREGLELEFDLRSALEKNQFRLVYQPVYNLDDLTIVSVEALLRWEHPTLGTVAAEKFIAILERTGQIRDVGQWVLGEACDQMAAWHARGSHLSISVNVSARQFDTDDIVDQVRVALERSGLDPPHLTLEITESALMHNLTAGAERLRAIKTLGPQIAIDDFGTGYSSLAYLQRLPVDSLKIDRSFISATASSTPESRALVRTIVQLGKDLGLKTLAEGVETMEQAEQLRGDNVDEVQGFLLAHPLERAALEDTILFPLTVGVEQR